MQQQGYSPAQQYPMQQQGYSPAQQYPMQQQGHPPAQPMYPAQQYPIQQQGHPGSQVYPGAQPQMYGPPGYYGPAPINIVVQTTANAVNQTPSLVRRSFPHGMHLIITIFTCGAWLPFWIILALLHKP
jgi:hypothetical protein